MGHIHLTSRQLTTLQVVMCLQFFAGKTPPQPAEAENAFQEFIESQSIDLYPTGIKKLISHWQKCVDCNSSYFD